MFIRRINLGILLLLIALPCFSGKEVGDDEKYSEELIKWMRAMNGFFSPKLEIRRTNPNDPDSRLGIYAQKNLKVDELILRVPTSIIISGVEKDAKGPEGQYLECPTIRNLIKELNLMDESVYAPYLRYLRETQPHGVLPSAWSKAGQLLLYRVISDDRSVQVLPPDYPSSWIEDYREDCGGTDNLLEEYAALLVIQRSWDDLLLPVHDMMSHRNGKWLNTESTRVHEERPVEVWASRDINVGEEIYTTYNLCADCEARYETYGTPEILRDYGFVENYPQTWIFHDIEVGFRVDHGQDNSNMGEIKFIEWIGKGEPNENDISSLVERLNQVIENKKSALASYDPNIPETEWKVIFQYISAMEAALKAAIDRISNNMNSCIDGVTCANSLEKYSDLDKYVEIYTDPDYSGYTCDIEKTFEVFDNGQFEMLEEIESQYQDIVFSWNPKNRDTCMDLDNIVQICDSYRPHYHEMVVHYTARFLPKIKRVLFVGGGDSMLLHEILKYPTLELVVGLELDQRVTRGAFKHFGTQPHFENEKVQWWYGDASKSLLMLPKDYFASFDMVLVDLSETVMSFQVTSELDVLDALTLLLKPGGIFVKNEVYFGKFQKMFPYSAQIHWYDNPVICSQVIVLGSRTVDFMKPSLTDHGVEGLFIKPLGEINDPFDIYHDYARNETSRQLCDTMEGTSNRDLTEQIRSPGILMIVEAENASQDLSNLDATEELLINALRKEKLEIMSSTTTASNVSSVITIVLMEGYVIARALYGRKYCAFDIHLWSGFEKQESTKKALIEAVGSTSYITSFRIIAGGMFGVPAWKEDKKSYGPQYDEICNKLADTTGDTRSLANRVENNYIIQAVMEKSLSILGDSLKIAVLCANDMDKIERYDGIGRVQNAVTFSCPSMLNFNEFASDSSHALALCEKYLSDVLVHASNDGKFDALVIDSSTDKFTLSILLNIFTRMDMNERLLAPGATVISIMTDKRDEWLKNCFKLFKSKVFVDEPASYNEISIGNWNDSFTLLLSTKGGENFLQNMATAMVDLEEEIGLKIDVVLSYGGLWRFQEDFVPTQHFVPDDFDRVSSLKQWNSQIPVGHQIITQLESKEKSELVHNLSPGIIKRALKTAISQLSDVKDLTDVAEHIGIGDGCLLLTCWSEGTVVVLWDGRGHVDLNIFGLNAHHDKLMFFEKVLIAELNTLETVLRDVQPRGIGNVVSYAKDIQGGVDAHWA